MIRTNTLKSKIITSFTAVGILYLLLSTVVMLVLFRDYSMRVSRKQQLQMLEDFAKSAEINFIYFNYMNLARQTEELLKDSEVTFVSLFDAEGNEIIFRSSREIEQPELVLPQKGEISIDQLIINRENHVILSAPVQIDRSDMIWGYVSIGISLEGRDRLITSMRNAALLFSSLLFLVALVFITVVAGRITAPVDTLKKGLEKVAMGDFTHRINIASQDEFSYLGAHFNAMAEKIEAVLQELETQQKDLERQVNIRTDELNQTNLRLSDALQRLQETQKHIIQSEKQKSLMAIVSGFAHEINNPLTGIIGYVELLLMRGEIPVQYKEKLLSIQKQADRIKGIVDQLNQLNPEIEQTKMEIDLKNLLLKLTKVVSSKPENKSVVFEKSLPEEEMFIFGNHFSLWQVFDCILENSLDAIRENGIKEGKVRVILSRNEKEGLAKVEIIDNGGGIENLEKVFDPFFTTRNRAEKKGIGLSIAYNIIQEHKGNIMIENNEFSGTTVTVFLQLSDLNRSERISGGKNA